jgi:hypothetical protein
VTTRAVPARADRIVGAAYVLLASARWARGINGLTRDPMTRHRVLPLFLAAAVSACTGRSPEPAVVVFRSDTATFELPVRVRAHEQFVVSFTVYAGGCTGDTARTHVRVRSRTAEIRPMMLRAASETCPAVMRILRKSVPVRFDTPGDGLIRVVGSREGPPSDSAGQRYTGPAVLERRVFVLPGPR